MNLSVEFDCERVCAHELLIQRLTFSVPQASHRMSRRVDVQGRQRQRENTEGEEATSAVEEDFDAGLLASMSYAQGPFRCSIFVISHNIISSQPRSTICILQGSIADDIGRA